MPRKDRTARPTRAESFFSDFFGPGRRRTVGQVATLLEAGQACAVDAPLTEAIEGQLLSGDLADLRVEVAIEIVVGAKSGAAASYVAQAVRPALLEQQRRAGKIAASLRELIDQIGDDAAAADKAHDAADEPRPTGEDWTLVMRANALLPLLDAYAAASVAKGDATDQEADQFLREFDRWWKGRATAREQRGAQAVRNRIAGALWIDAGGTVSVDQTPEEWARQKFRKIAR
jgi:hypothetical protein